MSLRLRLKIKLSFDEYYKFVECFEMFKPELMERKIFGGGAKIGKHSALQKCDQLIYAEF